ncbi:MAG TPA: hypothetical protein VE665_03125 [Hyphomicrobiaceae bacterium]|nr:hypothetical protein [Hyphomicrobiaceae bacterium]
MNRAFIEIAVSIGSGLSSGFHHRSAQIIADIDGDEAHPKRLSTIEDLGGYVQAIPLPSFHAYETQSTFGTATKGGFCLGNLLLTERRHLKHWSSRSSPAFPIPEHLRIAVTGVVLRVEAIV